jgi:hypothetical protein
VNWLSTWFHAVSKGVLRMRPERLIAPGRFTALPTAGVDFEGAFAYLIGDGLYVCQPDGGGGWEWLRVEGTVLP